MAKDWNEIAAAVLEPSGDDERPAVELRLHCGHVLALVDAEVTAAVAHDRQQHDLANGGCVPKPAYDELAAAVSEAQAALVRVRALADAFADDDAPRYGGNIAWHIEEAIANEKGDFPDAADLCIASQRERADRLEQGIRALADEMAGYRTLNRSWPWVDRLRALLSPSPAATTGEAARGLSPDEMADRADKARADAARPAPVSSGEAGHHPDCRIGGTHAAPCRDINANPLPAPVVTPNATEDQS